MKMYVSRIARQILDGSHQEQAYGAGQWILWWRPSNAWHPNHLARHGLHFTPSTWPLRMAVIQNPPYYTTHVDDIYFFTWNNDIWTHLLGYLNTRFRSPKVVNMNRSIFFMNTISIFFNLPLILFWLKFNLLVKGRLLLKNHYQTEVR